MAIDLSQGYSILLTKKGQKICTTILPKEKYACKRLLMGIAYAPDIFELIMLDLLSDLDYVLVYINDILLLQRQGESKEDHLTKMEVLLKRLNDIVFSANLCESFLCKSGFIDNRRTKTATKESRSNEYNQASYEFETTETVSRNDKFLLKFVAIEYPYIGTSLQITVKYW